MEINLSSHNFICPMNSCESRYSDFNNLKNHFQRRHKIKALQKYNVESEQDNQIAEKNLKLQSLYAKYGNKKSKLYLNNDKEYQNKTIAQPFHCLEHVNFQAQAIRSKLDNSFNTINDHVIDLKKDRTIKNELNVDVMMQIIKRNTLMYDLKDIATIPDAKDRYAKAKAVTRELIEELNQEADPDRRKHAYMYAKGGNFLVDYDHELYDQIEKDLNMHKERQKLSKKNVEKIDNIYKSQEHNKIPTVGQIILKKDTKKYSKKPKYASQSFLEKDYLNISYKYLDKNLIINIERTKWCLKYMVYKTLCLTSKIVRIKKKIIDEILSTNILTIMEYLGKPSIEKDESEYDSDKDNDILKELDIQLGSNKNTNPNKLVKKQSTKLDTDTFKNNKLKLISKYVRNLDELSDKENQDEIESLPTVREEEMPLTKMAKGLIQGLKSLKTDHVKKGTTSSKVNLSTNNGNNSIIQKNRLSVKSNSKSILSKYSSINKKKFY